MGFWNGVVRRLRNGAARIILPGDLALPPSSAIDKSPIYPPPRPNSPSRIYTDISYKKYKRHMTTFAGALNPRPDGSVEAAFVKTLIHDSVPLKIGQKSFILPPNNMTLTESYATYMALALWGHRSKGGVVHCSGDNAHAMEYLGRGRQPPASGSGTRELASVIAVGMQDLAEENQVDLSFSWVPSKDNNFAHALSRCESMEDVTRLGGKRLRAQVETSNKELDNLPFVGLDNSTLWERFRRELAAVRQENNKSTQ